MWWTHERAVEHGRLLEREEMLRAQLAHQDLQFRAQLESKDLHLTLSVFVLVIAIVMLGLLARQSKPVPLARAICNSQIEPPVCNSPTPTDYRSLSRQDSGAFGHTHVRRRLSASRRRKETVNVNIFGEGLEQDQDTSLDIAKIGPEGDASTDVAGGSPTGSNAPRSPSGEDAPSSAATVLTAAQPPSSVFDLISPCASEAPPPPATEAQPPTAATLPPPAAATLPPPAAATLPPLPALVAREDPIVQSAALDHATAANHSSARVHAAQEAALIADIPRLYDEGTPEGEASGALALGQLEALRHDGHTAFEAPLPPAEGAALRPNAVPSSAAETPPFSVPYSSPLGVKEILKGVLAIGIRNLDNGATSKLTGSAFVIDAERGLIATCAHVVMDSYMQACGMGVSKGTCMVQDLSQGRPHDLSQERLGNPASDGLAIGTADVGMGVTWLCSAKMLCYSPPPDDFHNFPPAQWECAHLNLGGHLDLAILELQAWNGTALFQPLKLTDGSQLRALSFGDSAHLELSQKVFVVGWGQAPGCGGQRGTLTLTDGCYCGSVAGLGSGSWLKTNCNIHSGHSGSPVLKANGEVVGWAVKSSRESSFVRPIETIFHVLREAYVLHRELASASSMSHEANDDRLSLMLELTITYSEGPALATQMRQMLAQSTLRIRPGEVALGDVAMHRAMHELSQLKAMLHELLPAAAVVDNARGVSDMPNTTQEAALIADIPRLYEEGTPEGEASGALALGQLEALRHYEPVAATPPTASMLAAVSDAQPAAALQIQSAWRMLRCSRDLRQKRAACVRLQDAAHTVFAMADHRRRKRAAVILQLAWRHRRQPPAHPIALARHGIGCIMAASPEDHSLPEDLPPWVLWVLCLLRMFFMQQQQQSMQLAQCELLLGRLAHPADWLTELNEAAAAVGSADTGHLPLTQRGSLYFISELGVGITAHHVLLDADWDPAAPSKALVIGLGDPITWTYHAEVVLFSPSPRKPSPGKPDHRHGCPKPWLDVAILKIVAVVDSNSGVVIDDPQIDIDPMGKRRILHPPLPWERGAAPQPRLLRSLVAANRPPRVGDWVAVLGYGQEMPRGPSRRTCTGRVVGWHSDPDVGCDLLVIDAAELGAHSGGAVVDMLTGHVIASVIYSFREQTIKFASGKTLGVGGRTHAAVPVEELRLLMSGVM